MRLLRVPVAAAIFAALLAQPSAAQEGRPFHNAWFWGVKGGILNYSSNPAAGAQNGPCCAGTDNAGALMVGLDWLITRSRGGLYVSLDQSFVNTTVMYRSPYVPGDPYLDVSGLRRISAVGMLFPMQTPTFHPYVGMGASVNQLGDLKLQSGIGLPALAQAARDSIQAKRVAIAPMFMAGVQQRLPGFSVFAQGSGTFLPDGFYLKYLEPKRYLQWTVEAGIRYNVGSSIDRER
jgi:hypothetical protein